MMNSNLHANRGGLTPGAFGGHERLDKCDLTGPRLADATAEDQNPRRAFWNTRKAILQMGVASR